MTTWQDRLLRAVERWAKGVARKRHKERLRQRKSGKARKARLAMCRARRRKHA